MAERRRLKLVGSVINKELQMVCLEHNCAEKPQEGGLKKCVGQAEMFDTDRGGRRDEDKNDWRELGE